MTRALVVLQERYWRLRADDDGLTILAYALGAGAVLVPLAIFLIGFGGDTASDASVAVDGALGN